jgi:hypothetical protein
VAFRTPAQLNNNATNLSEITITFDEPMLASSAVSGSVTVSGGASPPTCALSWASDSLLVCDLPDGYLFQQGVTYTVALSSQLKDASPAANALSPTSFMFTTDLVPDVTPPTLQTWNVSFASGVTPPIAGPYAYPTPGGVDLRGVATTTYLTFTFSESVKSLAQPAAPAQLSDAHLHLRRNGNPNDLLPFVVTQIDATTQRIDPGGTLSKGDYVEWVIQPTLTDQVNLPITGAPLSGKFRFISEETVTINGTVGDGWVHQDVTDTDNTTIKLGVNDEPSWGHIRAFVTFPISTPVDIRVKATRVTSAAVSLCQWPDDYGTPFTTLGLIYLETIDFGNSLSLADYDSNADECPPLGFCNPPVFSTRGVSVETIRTLDVTTSVRNIEMSTTRDKVQFRLKHGTSEPLILASHLTRFYSADATSGTCGASALPRRPQLSITYEFLGPPLP